MKNLALDIGDVWIGTAISDALGILATPYKTISADSLDSFLQELLQKEPVGRIIIGNPITLRGTESKQTLKVHTQFDELKKRYPQILWVLWDERLTSKQAERIKQGKTKEEKLKAHSRAAALILETYLQHLCILSNKNDSY